MEIRKFRGSDAAQASSCITKAVLGTSTEYYPKENIAFLAAIYSPEKIKEEFAKKYCLVAVEGNEVLGTVGLRDGRVVGLFVHPSYLRKGIGTKLLRAIEKVAKEKGLEKVECQVSKDSVGFYEKQGYKVVKLVELEGIGELCLMGKKLD
jgi:ribosomal protein S18 acetylase RimI-like enzyme